MGGSSSSTTSAMEVEPKGISKSDQAKLAEMQKQNDLMEARYAEWEEDLANFKRMRRTGSSPDLAKSIFKVKRVIDQDQVQALDDFIASVAKINEMVSNLRSHEVELTKELGKDFFDRAVACSEETKSNLVETLHIVIHMKATNRRQMTAIKMLTDGTCDALEELDLAERVFSCRSKWEKQEDKLRKLQEKWKTTQETATILQSELEAKQEEVYERSWLSLLGCVNVVVGVAAVAVAMCSGGGFVLGAIGVANIVWGLYVVSVDAKRVAKKILSKAMECMQKTMAIISEISALCSRIVYLIHAAILGALEEIPDNQEIPAYERGEGETKLTLDEKMFLHECKESAPHMSTHLKTIDTQLKELQTKLKTMLCSQE